MTFEVGGSYLYALWTDAEIEEPSEAFTRFSAFYSDVHLPEVVRGNAGFISGTRGERLTAAAGDGYAGARYAALYGGGDEDAMTTYLARNVEGIEAPPDYSGDPPYFPNPLRGRGRGFYRRTERAEGAGGAAAVLVLVGHAGEGPGAPLAGGELARRGLARASRYRMERDLNSDGTHSPETMTLYEADAANAVRVAADPAALADRGEAALAYAVIAVTTGEPAAPAAGGAPGQEGNRTW